MVYAIRTSKPSIQRRSVSMWVFTYSMNSLYHNNYKWNSRHSTWPSYMATILSTISLVQIQTAITITLIHSLLSKKPWSKLHLKRNLQIGRYIIFLCGWTLYFHSFGCLVSPFLWMKLPCVSKVVMRTKYRWCTKHKLIYYRHMIFIRRVKISNIYVKLSCFKKIFS